MASNGNGEAGWMTIEELLARIAAARDGMSAANPNRQLLEQCRAAIVFLAERVPDESLRYREVRPS